MRAKLELLTATSNSVGLKINLSKTKHLKIMYNNNEKLVMNKTTIERVDQFSYLGRVIDQNGKDVQ